MSKDRDCSPAERPSVSSSRPDQPHDPNIESKSESTSEIENADETESTDENEMEVCKKCDKRIKRYVDRCRHCGYAPVQKAKRTGWACILVGIGISFAGIGALIGIPLAIMGILGLATAGSQSPAVPEDVDDLPPIDRWLEKNP
jgi:hypothetical protein